MSSPDIEALDLQPNESRHAILRLLVVADAAVAEASELPARVRAVIDAAAEVYVLTPTLPGRLAWLADDVDRCRHAADERLDTVLGHMRSISARARGDALRGSVLTVLPTPSPSSGPITFWSGCEAQSTPTGRSEG